MESIDIATLVTIVGTILLVIYNTIKTGKIDLTPLTKTSDNIETIKDKLNLISDKIDVIDKRVDNLEQRVNVIEKEINK